MSHIRPAHTGQANKESRMSISERVRFEGKVTCYPYRTAFVRDHIMTVPRNQLRDLEQKLAEAAEQYLPGNHVVYGVITSEGKFLYIMFTDLVAVFGLSVDENRW